MTTTVTTIVTIVAFATLAASATTTAASFATTIASRRALRRPRRTRDEHGTPEVLQLVLVAGLRATYGAALPRALRCACCARSHAECASRVARLFLVVVGPHTHLCAVRAQTRLAAPPEPPALLALALPALLIRAC